MTVADRPKSKMVKNENNNKKKQYSFSEIIVGSQRVRKQLLWLAAHII